jgi:hypothetical protein
MGKKQDIQYDKQGNVTVAAPTAVAMVVLPIEKLNDFQKKEKE